VTTLEPHDWKRLWTGYSIENAIAFRTIELNDIQTLGRPVNLMEDAIASSRKTQGIQRWEIGDEQMSVEQSGEPFAQRANVVEHRGHRKGRDERHSVEGSWSLRRPTREDEAEATDGG
jgi:hypothetical protein